MKELYPYQRIALDMLDDWFEKHLTGNPVLVLPTGCHAKDTLIIMHNGTLKPVQDIKIGDVVMGDDSSPRTVKQIHSGREKMFRIIPVKGESFIVNENHILNLVQTPTNKNGAFPSQRRAGDIVNISVKDYVGKSKWFKHIHKLRRVSVEFNQHELLPVPPYVLGALIGDGALTLATPCTTTPDLEIINEISDWALSIGCKVNSRWIDNKNCYNATIVDPKASRSTKSHAAVLLSSTGVNGLKSVDKFIPQSYKTASRHDRLEMIAGLLDTDGSYTHKGYDWITASEKLADDFVFICRSVGLAAYKKECIKHCQTMSGMYWRVSISGECDMVPCRVEHKKSNSRNQIKSVLVTGFTVEELNEDAFFGFELDGNHLYLTSDFVVHHNSGKSIVIADFCKTALTNWPETRIAMLTHQQELIQQNADELIEYWPNAPIGIYSAGLRKRELSEPITFAGIGSVWRRAEEIGHVDIILIDEAHLVNNEAQGMYRKLIAALKEINPHLRVIGLSATPYRLGQGLLTEGKNALFHDIIEPVTVSYLIKEGYLCELKSKSTSIKLDTTGVHKRGGDFIESELQAAVNNDLTNAGVVDEIIKRGADRKTAIIFATGILHAEELNRLLLERGEKSAIVTGKTPKKERAQILDDFKTGAIKYLVNCKVATTGFNNKKIDLIADVQPTLSPGLYVQKVGRGLRIHPDKTDCLVLDFAGNIATHGPITNIIPPDAKGAREGEAPVKTCPECDEIIHISVKVCPSCGYEWPIEEKTFKLSNEDIMGRDNLKTMVLTDWEWSIHTSRTSGKELLKVRYYGQIADPIVDEYLCVTYEGFAGNKARRTLVDIGIKSGADTSVKTLEDIVLSMQAATPPAALQYQKDGKFFTVMERIWE